MEWMNSKLTPNDMQHLSSYQRVLLERICPLLDRIHPAKVGEGSLAGITRRGDDWIIHIIIASRNKFIPGLELFAAPDQCNLSFAESEIIECHRNPEKAKELVDEVYAATERYLSGTTVLSSYNENGQLIRRDYFYGIDTENDPEYRIGTSRWLLVFPQRVHHTEKHSFSFLDPAAM